MFFKSVCTSTTLTASVGVQTPNSVVKRRQFSLVENCHFRLHHREFLKPFPFGLTLSSVGEELSQGLERMYCTCYLLFLRAEIEKVPSEIKHWLPLNLD